MDHWPTKSWLREKPEESFHDLWGNSQDRGEAKILAQVAKVNQSLFRITSSNMEQDGLQSYNKNKHESESGR